MAQVGSGRDGIGLRGLASGRSSRPTESITVISVGASIRRFTSTDLHFSTTATANRIVSAISMNLMDTVLNRPEASATEVAADRKLEKSIVLFQATNPLCASV